MYDLELAVSQNLGKITANFDEITISFRKLRQTLERHRESFHCYCAGEQPVYIIIYILFLQFWMFRNNSVISYTEFITSGRNISYIF
ncbi:hypothetical protein I230019B6_08900 [Firmicutes bacterium i23-0019-B6]